MEESKDRIPEETGGLPLTGVNSRQLAVGRLKKDGHQAPSLHL